MPPKPSAASSCSARIRTSTPRPAVSRAASAASHSGLLTADGVLARSLATATAPAMTAALLTCGLRAAGEKANLASPRTIGPVLAVLAVAVLAVGVWPRAEPVTAEQRSLGERLN